MGSKIHITRVGRLSFPSLFTPNRNTNDDGTITENYEATLIFPGGTDLADLETAIDVAAQNAWGEKKSAMLKKMKHYPIKSNQSCTDREGERRGGYEDDNGMYVKFKNARQPGVCGVEKDPANPLLPLALGSSEIKAGDYVRASYTVFCGVHDKLGPYAKMTLNNVQKVKDGEPFGATISDPAEDFADDADIQAALA